MKLIFRQILDPKMTNLDDKTENPEIASLGFA